MFYVYVQNIVHLSNFESMFFELQLVLAQTYSSYSQELLFSLSP